MTPAADSNALGTYLRARREQVRPETAGVPDQRSRRVPGLRREEVAFLAGVSSDYYVRLEQGRDKNPSDQVMLSIARALQLDEDATAYLLQLARPGSRRRKRARKPEKVSDGIRTLISGWPLTEMRELHQDWEEMTARIVPYLRSVAGPDVDDPRLVELVGELSLRSDRFRALWARQDVKHKSTGTSLLKHPQAGRLELHYEKLLIPAGDMQTLVTYHAQPGSESEERLRLLASVSAPDDSCPASSPLSPGEAPRWSHRWAHLGLVLALTSATPSPALAMAGQVAYGLWDGRHRE
jgi:transcriptional regulator with XRE-family HTH domain